MLARRRCEEKASRQNFVHDEFYLTPAWRGPITLSVEHFVANTKKQAHIFAWISMRRSEKCNLAGAPTSVESKLLKPRFGVPAGKTETSSSSSYNRHIAQVLRLLVPSLVIYAGHKCANIDEPVSSRLSTRRQNTMHIRRWGRREKKF